MFSPLSTSCTTTTSYTATSKVARPLCIRRLTSVYHSSSHWFHLSDAGLPRLSWKTHTHTQPFNGLWSGTTRVGRYQKKHSPTHAHPDHRTSFINFLHLLRSIASSLFSLRARQSSLTTFPGPLWFSSWTWTLYFILHAFLHPINIFSQHMPIPTQPVLL